ncbi:hypothetical protein IJ096_03120 [Candidatus Saccharibacteria bacterium]|nr:hypothetical protein [Candidatus Saccharibacteria bacterium]
MKKWPPGWESKGGLKKGGEIKNLEMVKELYDLYRRMDVRLVFVRGHQGTAGNEAADRWANLAREGEG